MTMTISDFPWAWWWFGTFASVALCAYGWRDGVLLILIMLVPAELAFFLAYFFS